MMLRTGRRKRRNRQAGFTSLEIKSKPQRYFLSLAGFTPSEIKHRRHDISLAGFTLIELIIVAAIISILVAVSTPLFRSTFANLELEDSSYNLGKIIKYAQQSAIVKEEKYRIVFNFEDRSYRLLVESKQNGKSSFEKLIGRFGKAFYLPEGLRFKGDKDTITFLPNGRCDKISIYIFNRKNKAVKVRTIGRAGRVEISEVKEK